MFDAILNKIAERSQATQGQGRRNRNVWQETGHRVSGSPQRRTASLQDKVKDVQHPHQD